MCRQESHRGVRLVGRDFCWLTSGKTVKVNKQSSSSKHVCITIGMYGKQ
jgi:hypothetical protein